MTRTQPPIRYGLIAVFLSVFAMVYIASAHPFSLSFQTNESRWKVILDGVMDGLSIGEVDRTSDGIVFHGDLPLKNNGGFSQIRTRHGGEVLRSARRTHGADGQAVSGIRYSFRLNCKLLLQQRRGVDSYAHALRHVALLHIFFS